MELTINTNTNTTSYSVGIDPFICPGCGNRATNVVDVIGVYGTACRCQECASSLEVCDACNSPATEITEVVVGSTEENWCPNCIGEASWCEHCERYHTNETFDVCVNDSYYSWDKRFECWCKECYENDAVACDCCGEAFEDGELDEYKVWGGDVKLLCRRCIENYHTCHECGTFVADDDATYHDHGHWYCPDCTEDHIHLFGYHHNTDPNKFWFDDGSSLDKYDLRRMELQKTLFLGIELETDYNDHAGKLARDIFNQYDNDYLISKEDSSLDEEGVEIVSNPMTPMFHLTSGMWETVVETVRAHDGLSYTPGTCGLHIHVSRDALSGDDAVYRLDRMFHRFADEMITFSRRDPNSRRGLEYCHLDTYDELADIKDVKKRKDAWKTKKYYQDRYHAVNDENDNTVELRLWRGSLNMETIRATIEWTTGLVFVVNAMSDEFADQLTWSMLKVCVKFALEEKGIPHDDLDAYLKRRGL